MKKLYAKTTFANRKASGKHKQNEEAAKDVKNAARKQQATANHPHHNSQIIMAFQNQPQGMRDDARLVPPFDEAPMYYSIAELEQLNMLDHRHPQFHQDYHQRYHMNQSTQPQHKLVLQLPIANGTSHDLSATSDTHTKATAAATTPIYEAPQISSAQAVNHSQRDAVNSNGVGHHMDADDVDYITSGFGSMPIVRVLQQQAAKRGNPHSNDCLDVRMDALSTLPRAVRSAPPSNANSTSSLQRTQSISVHSHSHAGPHNGNEVHHYSNQPPPQTSFYARQQHPGQYLRHNSVKEKFISANLCATVFAEQSIIGARASVMVYDDNQKKWVPSGSSSGLSKVQIYHHQQNNTFRVVGRKLQDHEVVINCSILKGLKYNQATATFHQWRDAKFVYGLNFSSQHDAEAFARAMMHALEVLSGRVANNPGQPTNGNGYEEDMGYRTMTSEDAAILRQQQQITGQVTPSAQTPTSQTNQNNIPQSPPTPQGHHRTSRNSLSAPAAPQPQQMSMPPQQMSMPPQQQQAQQPQHQQLYGQTVNGPTLNGMPQQPQQIPAAPGPPHHLQQQSSHAIYASQQMVPAGYPPQNQYPPQPHYVLSSSNPNLNQYSQQQSGVVPGAPPMPPPHQVQNGGGPIYVSAPPQGIPTSASSNSVVYASQQPMGGNGPPQPPNMPNAPPLPPNAYGQMNGAQSQQESPYGQVPNAPPMMPNNSGNVPMPPPLNRMSSIGSAAPAAPPPPPAFGGFNGNAGGGSAPPPPAPPAPPAMGAGAPPPPPPPPMGGLVNKSSDPQADLMGSLAAQLQQAKLKKNKQSTAPPPENSGSSTSSGGSGNYGTIGRSTCGMASMMDEMAKTLARRRAQAEKREPEQDTEVKGRPWEKSNTLPHKLGSSNSNNNSNNASNSGGESPRPNRKRFGSASEETILKVNGDGLSIAISGTDLDTLKAEIIREMKLEVQKVKQEIIDAIKSEFNRR